MTFNINVYLNPLMKKKPENLVFLDLTKLDAAADFFIICHGKTSRQVTSIAEYVKLDLKRNDILPIGFEGFKEGNWVILDYGKVVVHIFHETFRKFYNLEGLWADAIIYRVNKGKTNDIMSFAHMSNDKTKFESIIID